MTVQEATRKPAFSARCDCYCHKDRSSSGRCDQTLEALQSLLTRLNVPYDPV